MTVYLTLWRNRTGQSFLLDWAGSSGLYAAIMIGFGVVGDHPVAIAVLHALLGASSLLVLTGVDRFDGLPKRRPWAIPLILLPGLGYLGPRPSAGPDGRADGRHPGFGGRHAGDRLGSRERPARRRHGRAPHRRTGAPRIHPSLSAHAGHPDEPQRDSLCRSPRSAAGGPDPAPHPQSRPHLDAGRTGASSSSPSRPA